MVTRTKEISRRKFVVGAATTALAAGFAGGVLVGCSPSDSSEVTEGSGDTWIPTTCNMCFNGCAILVRVVDGVALEIKGNPDSSIGGGRLCSKGASGLMQLYDPHRVTKPLKRTNPNKGLDEDPGWEEISLDEAIDLFLEKFIAASQEDPRNVALSSMISQSAALYPGVNLFAALGMGGFEKAFSDICGAGVHCNEDIFTGTGNAMPDYSYCNYLVQFGTQAGTATRHGFNMTAKMFADRRVEGCKLVNFDPHMSAAGDKADEWIPLIPGTDAVIALAMSNVLVNELGIYDSDYLKVRTNAPSLVDVATQRVIRDPESNKALYWDEAAQGALSYDTAKEPMLEGTIEFDGKTCKTGWTLYKEHMTKYTPEYAESISTVPADKIRRIAKEFGEAARIGETIEIDGYVLPYRPVCADTFSGISRHKHSFLSNWAIQQLNIIVGSCNSVGGFIGYAPVCNGYSDEANVTWRPDYWEEDGLLNYTSLVYPVGGTHSYYDFIRNNIGVPTNKAMSELQPLAMDTHFYWVSQFDPSFYNDKYPKSKDLFVLASNPLKWWGDFDEQAQMLSEYEYVVGVDVYLNDSSYFYDLVIPEACYLERYDLLDNTFLAHRHLGGLNMDWNFCLRQPVVPARDGCLGAMELFCEIANRAGAEANAAYSGALGAFFFVKDEYSLPSDEKLDVENVIDSVFKSLIDAEHGLEWFKENGSYRYPRKVDEVYIWANGDPGRVPVYQDMFLEAKEKISTVVDEMGIYWETDDWQPLPDWKPCHEYEITDPEYNILPIYWTNQVNTDTWQVQNPYLNELNEQDPFGYTVEINAAVAAEKGITDGDKIAISSPAGRSVYGIAVLSEAIHPQCIAVLGGHWNARSKYLPIAENKGVAIVDLIPGCDATRLDHTCAGYDQCIRVKVEKA